MVVSAVITLSSSPPRQLSYSSFSATSLPLLASPKEAGRKRPLIPSGKCAAPIPKDAILTFTSATSLLRLPDVTDDEYFDTDNMPDIDSGNSRSRPTDVTLVKDGGLDAIEVPKVKKARGLRKRPTELGIDGGISDKKLPHKSKGKNLDSIDSQNGATVKSTRKLRAKTSETEKQTKLPKGRIGKATITSKSTNKKESEDFKLVKKTVAEPKQETLQAEDLDLGLEQAILRKREWTPPSTMINSPPLENPGSPNSTDGSGHDGPVNSDIKINGFQNLLENFGYANCNTTAVDINLTKTVPLGKRKAAELVATNSPTLAILGAKAKPPSKKIRTITGQATAAYRAEGDSPHQVTLAPSLRFDTELTNKTLKPLSSKLSKSQVKSTPKRKLSKPKKGTATAPILLSPESALKQASRQDFVFGTSSQLAREDSPTLLRDLHAAMQASNALEYSHVEEYLDEPSLDEENYGHEVTKKAKSNLWSAATRDQVGKLLGIETADLINTPDPYESAKVPGAVGNLLDMTLKDEVWDDIDMVETPVASPLSLPGAQAHENNSTGASELSDSDYSRHESDCQGIQSSQTFVNKSEVLEPPSGVAEMPSAVIDTSNPNISNMPNYASYTTAQLAKEIALYHFKPIKRRDKMITLLEKCWESKRMMALKDMGTNTIITTSTLERENQKSSHSPSEKISQGTESPKRQRGRPRKAMERTMEASENVHPDNDTPPPTQRTPRRSPVKIPLDDEIYDPEPTTPSPPRRELASIGTPPQSLPLSREKDLGISKFSTETLQKKLFKHITQAIRDAPRSKDSLEPNWYEKILLYDPIVLEDLATWLNTGALQNAGWNGEVALSELKKWCESKSICCLWKENLRGKTRSRF